MRKNSIVVDFATWLRSNRDRFPVRLVASRARADGRQEYRFQGVPFLRISVGTGSFYAAVMYRRRFVDEILIADVPQSRRSKAGKHYCVLCKAVGKAEYAKDRLSLLMSHTFEPFLDWSIETIREDSLLVVEEGPGACTTARIFSLKELKADWKRFNPGFAIERLISIKQSGSPSRRGRRA